MPLRRGEVVGYDADLMAFKFTMRMASKLCNARSAMPRWVTWLVVGGAGSGMCRLSLRRTASLSKL
jgi:phage terminase large subunit-like protein